MKSFIVPAILTLLTILIGPDGYCNPTNHTRSFYDGWPKDSLVPVKSQDNGVIESDRLSVTFNAREVFSPAAVLINERFNATAYGNIPEGWNDLLYRNPSRNWIVDAHGFLRPVLKDRAGLIALANSGLPANVRIESDFKKTEDSSVFFAIAGRMQDKDNFYAVMAASENRLVIAKIKDGKFIPLTEIIALKRYHYPEVWKMTASFHDDLISGILYDADGKIMARADARDGEFSSGTCGLYCTDYGAAETFSVSVPGASSKGNRGVKQTVSPMYNSASPLYSSYRLIKPALNPESLNTTFENTENQYDIIVAGAGTGGWAAAVEAARQGRRVLLLEESDWIGGQMAAAAVSSMDESGPLIRERGLYREFQESMAAYYYSMDKCPFMAYFWGRKTQNQQEGGYEPLIARNVLYGFIRDARQRAAQSGSGGKLDLLLRTRVTRVIRRGSTVRGVEVMQWNEGGEKKKTISCKILIDATEYGDVIPLTGAAYRVGNTKSEDHNLNGVVQDHTYTAVIREYPDGIPDSLRMKEAPPGYQKYRKGYLNRVIYGDWVLHKGARMFRAELAWRGMADSQSSLVGKQSQLRHTLTGLNGGNDYPVTVATIESMEQRLKDERNGIYKTLSYIYYLQHELGVPWSVAADQGFNTAYNRYAMRRRGIEDAFLGIAKYLPQMPYVREGRRIEGVKILVADDLTRGEKAKHFPTSIAIGDYFMDLHGTADALEKDLDKPGYAHTGGAFQIPFEAFIPKKLDGFLPAEKNFSQSRLVNGATRLQPITMLTGEAVGTIACLAIEKGVQPRKLKPLCVQLMLLDQGSTLSPRWYTDVAWGTDLWKALQVLSLYGIMDKPGGWNMEYRDGMEFIPKEAWEPGVKISGAAAQTALQKLAALLDYKVHAASAPEPTEISFAQLQQIANGLNSSLDRLLDKGRLKEVTSLTRGEFALECLEMIKEKMKVVE